LVLKSELNFNGPITRIDYYSAGANSNISYYTFGIWLCHTNLSTLTDTFANNYGGNTPVQVLSANPFTINTTAANQWFGMNFDNSFNYNNNDNLLIEIRWRNTASTPAVANKCWDTGQSRFLEAEIYEATTGTLDNRVNYLRISHSNVGVEPASLGRVKATFE